MRVRREFAFRAAHHLPSYGGEPEPEHEHDWQLVITCEAPVGPEGMALDFHALDGTVEERVIGRVRGGDVNAVVPVSSAENVALWVFDELEGVFPLVEVAVMEAEGCWAICDRGSWEAEKARAAATEDAASGAARR